MTPAEKVEELEELFLLRQFTECLEKSRAELAGIQIAGQHHHCSTEGCLCLRLVFLVAQALFELGRANEIIDFILSFYGDERLPYPIVWLCANLLLTTGHPEEAKNLIGYYVGAARRSGPAAGGGGAGALKHTSEEFEKLIVFLFVHILLAQDDLEEAASFLRFNTTLLPPPKMEELARLLEAKTSQRRREREDREKTQQRASAEAAAAAAAPHAPAPPIVPSLKDPPRPAAQTEGGPLLHPTDAAGLLRSAQASNHSSAVSPSPNVRDLPLLSSRSLNLFAYISAVLALVFVVRWLRRTGLGTVGSSIKKAFQELLEITFSYPYYGGSYAPPRR